MGAVRTAQPSITAVSGKTGSATIMFVVSDGTLSSSITVTLKAGGNGAGRLDGTNGADILFGQNGNDTLNGSSGNDLLCGGNGDDTISGGEGADRFDGGAGTDRVTDFKSSEGDTQTKVP